jgi:hypothetical protein
MRTKTLLVTAALSVAGIASSMAQVYSVNAVGYVNVSIATSASAFTYAIIANPLNGSPDNNLSTVLPTIPDLTQLYFFRGGSFESSLFIGEWIPNTSWNPGEAAFIELAPGSPDPTTVTFVGEVPQGHLENPVPTGYSLRSSIVPQRGLISTDLGFTPNSLDQVYLFRGTYESYLFLDGAWLPSEPTLEVAEGFFAEILNGAAINWVRDFQVSP